MGELARKIKPIYAWLYIC